MHFVCSCIYNAKSINVVAVYYHEFLSSLVINFDVLHTDFSSDPVACLDGYFALLGDATCTICPAGSYCTTVTSTACAAGKCF
jgi:hypothetical protein